MHSRQSNLPYQEVPDAGELPRGNSDVARGPKAAKSEEGLGR